MNTSESTGNGEPEILRGLAILAVVGLQATWFLLAFASLDGAAGRSVALAHLLTGFGFPLMMALSALDLSSCDDAQGSRPGFLEVLRGRAWPLVPGYLAWSLLTVALQDPARLMSPGDLARLLLNGDADDHFFFVPLLLVLFLAWPLLRPFVTRAAASGPTAAALLGAGTAASVVRWSCGSLGVLAPAAVTNFALWAVFAAMGMVAGPRLAAVRTFLARPAVLAATIVVTGVTAWRAYRRFILMVEPDYLPDAVWRASLVSQVPPALYAVAAVAMLAALATAWSHRWGRRLLVSIGERSWGIYLVHVLILRFVVHPLFPPYEVHGASLPATLAAMAVSWTACLVASYLLVAALHRLRFTRPLVSANW